jgi:hypothetical protein
MDGATAAGGRSCCLSSDDVDVMGARYGGRRRRGGGPGGMMSLLERETLSGLPKEVQGFTRSLVRYFSACASYRRIISWSHTLLALWPAAMRGPSRPVGRGRRND